MKNSCCGKPLRRLTSDTSRNLLGQHYWRCDKCLRVYSQRVRTPTKAKHRYSDSTSLNAIIQGTWTVKYIPEGRGWEIILSPYVSVFCRESLREAIALAIEVQPEPGEEP